MPSQSSARGVHQAGKSVQAVSAIQVFVYALLGMAESTNACICEFVTSTDLLI